MTDRDQWRLCSRSCPTLMPAGQRCFECAVEAVAQWKRDEARRHTRATPAAAKHAPASSKRGGPRKTLESSD